MCTGFESAFLKRHLRQRCLLRLFDVHARRRRRPQQFSGMYRLTNTRNSHRMPDRARKWGTHVRKTSS